MSPRQWAKLLEERRAASKGDGPSFGLRGMKDARRAGRGRIYGPEPARCGKARRGGQAGRARTSRAAVYALLQQNGLRAAPAAWALTDEATENAGHMRLIGEAAGQSDVRQGLPALTDELLGPGDATAHDECARRLAEGLFESAAEVADREIGDPRQLGVVDDTVEAFIECSAWRMKQTSMIRAISGSGSSPVSM